MIQIQTTAPWSGLLIDINICVYLQGVVNCIFVHLHSSTFLLLLPLTANQTLLQPHQYIWGFYLILLFICTFVWERLFWVRRNLVFKALTNGRGCLSGRFGVYVCVYTIMLLCLSPQI